MDHYILSIRSLRPIDKVSLACLKSQFMNDRGVIKHSQNDSKPCARQPLVPFSQPPHQVPKVLLNPESIKHIILKEKKKRHKNYISKSTLSKRLQILSHSKQCPVGNLEFTRFR